VRARVGERGCCSLRLLLRRAWRMMCWRSPWQLAFVISLSPPRQLTQSLGPAEIDSSASGRRHSATPCHAMPGPVRSTVGAFPSGCPLIHARLRQACMQHRARCDAHYPYIHEIAWPPAYALQQHADREPSARGEACGAREGQEASVEGRAVC
jgi:hypothetical protein